MKGLYIHIPFCKSKCGYCGFYSETDSYHLQEQYLLAVVEDLQSRENRKYDTLYIGGGTPSSLDTNLLAGFLDKMSVMHKGQFTESTIEANPESVTPEFLEIVSYNRYTRLSLGCQSTSDATLQKLGRIHTADDIYKAVEKVRKYAPYTALNLDLIYDIPDVSPDVTEKTLRDIISLEPDHISAYSYSHDREFLPDTDTDETDFEKVREVLTKAGYGKYEISNYAKPGRESLHNINYWQLGDYDGIGASAWSLENSADRRILKGKTSDITEYMQKPASFAETEESCGDKIYIEKLVFGLRMSDGVNTSDISDNISADLRAKLSDGINALVEKELLRWEEERVSLTLKGELLLDSVQEYFWRLLP